VVGLPGFVRLVTQWPVFLAVFALAFFPSTGSVVVVVVVVIVVVVVVVALDASPSAKMAIEASARVRSRMCTLCPSA
jgi:hypothetical protein